MKNKQITTNSRYFCLPKVFTMRANTDLRMPHLSSTAKAALTSRMNTMMVIITRASGPPNTSTGAVNQRQMGYCTPVVTW